ncbi:MAG: B12-binding domain-containing radical SAM protein [candidate division KSB1 bacterium]|nr:B12-binding domain-containing radical SAM protein [candidate division KSB1 bacterium]
MKILFVNPKTPDTFWSFSHAVKFISKRASDIPLGLVTVAAMLPESWTKRLIDLNVSPLRDKDLLWADYVFLGGMNAQKESFMQIVRRCNRLGVKVVAGGPLVTMEHESILGVDHFILNEAEATLPLFLEDLQGTPKAVYTSAEFPDLDRTPIPQYELLKMNRYAEMAVQYSRGCPFDCEFCSITVLNGRKPRCKSTQQFLEELQRLYDLNWRGAVFIVDDNFIGNKKRLKEDLLGSLIRWSRDRRYPFQFTTEASINLADDDELIELMVQAGFRHTFIGIETPDEESLAECGKVQNRRRDLLDSVRKLQQCGLIVSGGFIVGFDHDPPSIFSRQIEFIQRSGIVTAMVGLLSAPTGSRLFQRLKQENRLLSVMSGDNMDGSTNFIPKMNYAELLRGYRNILESIYSPKAYYARIKTFLKTYRPPANHTVRLTWNDVAAFLRSIWKIGILDKGRRHYWSLLTYSLFRRPKTFPTAVTLAIYGFHFRRVVQAI